MRKQIYLIALFVICSTIIGCNNQNKQALNIIDADFLRLDTLIRLHNWHILAPFYSDSNISTLDIIQQDLLLDFHSDERNIIDINSFIEIGKDISSENSNITFANVHIPHQIMDLEKVFEIEPPMTAYLACNIESTEECMAALNVSAYQSAKFWLNGVEIYNIEWKRGRNSFREEFIPVSLNKGTNFLLVKLSVSDKEYIPAQWKMEVDISSISTSKALFAECYNNHFIRKSHIAKGENLKLYIGVFDPDDVEIIFYKGGETISTFSGIINYNNVTKDLFINLSREELDDGVYTIELNVDNNVFVQDFFIGDIDNYLDGLKNEYKKLTSLSIEQKYNVEGIIRRTYMDVRRNETDFDDQSEYWSRLRIPSIVQLEKAIQQLKTKETTLSSFFLRSYYSEFWNGNNYYSAHVPPTLEGTQTIPVFIHLIDSETKTRDWEAHYRNTLARWLLNTEVIADELQFISIWTDCGGKIDKEEKFLLFEEIFEDITKNLPVNLDKIFVIGNCASTQFSLDLLNEFPNSIAGCGLINPNTYISDYFYSNHTNEEHKLSMIYGEYDELINEATSFLIFDKLKSKDPSAKLLKGKYGTHQNAPSYYSRPLYIDLMSR